MASSFGLSRRRFLVAGAALVGAAGLLPPAPAAAGPTTLRVVRRTLEVNGRAASVFGIQQPDGTPGIVTDNGAPFRVRLENRAGEATLVHWHGLTPPPDQDGMPGLSQPLLAPGAAYDYEFPLHRAGTFWMHSHHGLQEQDLLAAPLIVRDAHVVPTGDQEVVIMLHDFSFRPSEEIFAELTGGTGMMDHGMMDPDSQMDMGQGGMDHGAMDQGVEMPGMGHLNDVTYDAYLANDRTLDDPEIVPVEAGGNVRLRLINGAASTNFWIDLGGIEGEVVAIDGSNCRGQDGGPQPRGRLFPLAISQRIDIRLSRLPPGAHPIIARREGDTAQTGIILATPGAAIAQLPSQAASAAPALTLDLERRAAAYIKFDLRAADRRLKLDLTGSMLGFIWSLNGRKFGTHQPLAVREGELVEIEMINRTGMSHPMHLHSHTFRVVEIDGRRIDGPMRDTVLVPVDSSITIAFEADNPGRWAFHCHNLYHMAAGMMTTVEYEA